MEMRKEEPETINVWELMSGLDDSDEASARSPGFPAILVQKKQMTISPDLEAKLSLDSFTLEPPSEIPNFSGHRLLRNLDQRSAVFALEDPVTHVRTSLSNVSPPGLPFLNSSPLFGSASGQRTLSSLESLAGNLQRSLSFKLALDNENRSTAGAGDSLLVDSSKDDFSNDDFRGLTSESQSSEAISAVEPPSTPRSFISTSSKLAKWFKVNSRGAVKAQNSTRGGAKQEGNVNKLPRHANVLPSRDRSSMPSGNVIGDDISDQNSQPLHIPDNAEQRRAMGVGHGLSLRRYRHSFSNENQRRGSAGDDGPASINRPSSWELEKIVADAGFKAVLYSTHVRTDINAYEDSNAVRAILISLVGSAFDEKCVSQNPKYEQELKFALSLPIVAVPTVCVRGKYIAGIDNIMQFFKKGVLGSLLLQSLPNGLKPSAPCICRGGKFLICPICKGKRRITRQGEEPVSCRHCISTGLLKCPSCPK